MNAVSKNIRVLRLALGMTQEALANRLFVTRQTISNWENGKSQPDIDTLIKIADAMGTDVASLLYGFPDFEARRREKKRFLIAAGTLLILGVALFFIGPKMEVLKTQYYNIFPSLVLHLFLFPALSLLLGWTAMQGLGVLGVLKPVKSNCGKFVFAAAVTAVVLYPLMMAVYLGGQVPCPGWLMLAILEMIYQQPLIFLIPGTLLWLFRPPRKTWTSWEGDAHFPCDAGDCEGADITGSNS